MRHSHNHFDPPWEPSLLQTAPELPPPSGELCRALWSGVPPARGQQWPSCCFYCRLLQRWVAALWALVEVNGSTWDLISQQLLSGGLSALPKLGLFCLLPLIFGLLLSFHLVLLHSHWPLVWYKHFKSRPHDCLHLSQRNIKTSCCRFLRPVWNPQRTNPMTWTLWPGTEGRWVMPSAEATALSHTHICFLIDVAASDLLSQDQICIKDERSRSPNTTNQEQIKEKGPFVNLRLKPRQALCFVIFLFHVCFPSRPVKSVLGMLAIHQWNVNKE